MQTMVIKYLCLTLISILPILLNAQSIAKRSEHIVGNNGMIVKSLIASQVPPPTLDSCVNNDYVNIVFHITLDELTAQDAPSEDTMAQIFPNLLYFGGNADDTTWGTADIRIDGPYRIGESFGEDIDDLSVHPIAISGSQVITFYNSCTAGKILTQ
ncbi:MAG: hypothetical protein KAR19_19345 [Bacteroidales bacterium]|nr:hypothetical protein [Bacteroidales bacterium]